MKEVFKFYLKGKSSILNDIFAKTEQEKKKILTILILSYLILFLVSKFIIFLSPAWSSSYSIISVFSWIDKNILLAQDIIFILLMTFFSAFIWSFLFKKFWEKDWFLIIFINIFYGQIIYFLNSIIWGFFPYFLGNIGLTSVFFIVIFILAIWWLILSLILYWNRLKWWNILKYFLAYIILLLIISYIISFIIWFFLTFFSKPVLDNISSKYLKTNISSNSWETNIFYNNSNSSLWTWLNKKNSFWENKNNNSWSLENIKKEEKIIENNSWSLDENDDKKIKARNTFRKIYLKSVDKSLKDYFEKYSFYPENLQEENFKNILDTKVLEEKFKEKFWNFKAKNWCLFEINYEKNNPYTLKTCLENGEDYEIKWI